jgi:carboxyl-terminal processing protease
MAAVMMVAALIFSTGLLLLDETPETHTAPAAAQSNDAHFAPLFEAWDLLHEYYVDPLDDNNLVRAALTGMLDALNETETGDSEVVQTTLVNLKDSVGEEDVNYRDILEATLADLSGTLDEDAIDYDMLIEYALTSMLESVGDPNTDYIAPDRFGQIVESLNADFEGIGATVRKDEETGGLRIVRPLPDSPAENAGLRADDVVVTVDGEDITSLDEDIIISKVRGPAGTQVTLGVQRGDQEDLLEISITRARIALPTLDYEVFEDDIVYIRLYSFSRESDTEIESILRELDADNLNGLILDLRSNGGGYLDVSMNILGEFIEEGPLLIEKGTNNSEEIYQAFGDGLATEVPMVVIVDQASASASEVVAGALQDYERAPVVGMQTFGKGTVQTWRTLSNGGGVRITISRWYRPSGESVSPDGVTPDIEVEFPPLDEDETYSRETDPQIQAAIDILQSS